MTTSIVEYSATEAALADLAQKYKGVVFDVTVAEGMKSAKEARKELAGYRITLEKTRVAIKAPALKRTQEIDTEARRITSAISALEEPIDAQIYKEEKKAQIAAEAAAKAEAERIAVEQASIKAEEERKLAEERAALAAERAKLEAEQRASRERIEAEERAARMKIEEEARQERLARQAREEVERVKRQVEEERLKAEREKADAARREAEASIREAERIKSELLDGNNVLRMFVQKYGKREEFASVVPAINKYLEGLK